MKAGIKILVKNPNDKRYKSNDSSLYGVGVKIPSYIMGDAVRYIIDILNNLPNKKVNKK